MFGSGFYAPGQFGAGYGGISPLSAGLIGAGLGYLGGTMFDQDGPGGYGYPGGYGPGYGRPRPGFGGPGFGRPRPRPRPGFGGPGFGGPGPGFGGPRPGFGGPGFGRPGFGHPGRPRPF